MAIKTPAMEIFQRVQNKFYCDETFIYPGEKCLACNGIVHDVWPLIEHYHDCPEDLLESFQGLHHINFTLFRNVAIHMCLRAYELPKQCQRNVERMGCIGDMGNCYWGRDGSALPHYHMACQSFDDPFHDNDTDAIYKNVVCVLCEGRELPERACDMGPIYCPPPPPPHEHLCATIYHAPRCRWAVLLPWTRWTNKYGWKICCFF